MYIYIYIYTYIHTYACVYCCAVGLSGAVHRRGILGRSPAVLLATVSFQNSCLFSRPRPWQFEIRDSTDTQATCLFLGFETLNLKFCDF